MANFATKHSIMTQEMLDSFYIPAEVHPTAPGRGKTIFEFLAGKVGVYTRTFDVCGYTIPFTKFFMPICSAIQRPAINASYSASLLVASNLNPMAYVNSTPSGFVNISPAPKPSIQDEPSVNKVHGSSNSSGSAMSSSGDSSSGRSTIKSANICPLIDVLSLYWMSYPSSLNFHFSILLLISNFDNNCFIGRSVITTIVCAWKYRFSRLLALSKANINFFMGV
ncbi:hypothetical protein Tco_0626701 [Tanacetum coccineum]|uniref:Uncharacterized protein n=1 Tax=Tanacetum coccineum TaxID=301880 RepID=A0ABQ4WKF3_9ASTR